jgi:TonB family protein
MKTLIVILMLCSLAVSPISRENPLPSTVDVKFAVSPDYPAVAITANIPGDVLIRVTLGANGDVLETEFVSGPTLLRKAALDAARRWKFEKTAKETKAQLTFSFRMMPRDTPPEAMTPVFEPPYHIEVRAKLPESTRLP